MLISIKDADSALHATGADPSSNENQSNLISDVKKGTGPRDPLDDFSGCCGCYFNHWSGCSLLRSSCFYVKD